MQEYNEIKTRFFFFEDMNLASESIKHDDINQIRESNKIEKKNDHHHYSNHELNNVSYRYFPLLTN